MPEHSLSDHEAPMEVEDDQSGSDGHNDKDGKSPSHEAQVGHVARNENEPVLIEDEVESDQNDSLSNEEQDEGMDVDDDENENGDMNEDEDEEEEEEDDDMDEDGCIMVDLSAIHKQLECAICLGIIRKTRAVKDCLHRFCKECIEKALRVGKNQCPVCLTHVASRRSLRDDPNFDHLISVFFPQAEKYQEQDMILLEEEKTRYNEFQASITEIEKRQTEARKRSANATAEASPSSLQEKGSSSNAEKTVVTGPNEEGGEEETTPFLLPSANETAHETFHETVHETAHETVLPNAISSSMTTPGENDEENTEAERNARRSRCLDRLIEHLRNSDIKEEECDVFLVLASMDEQKMPSLKEPIITCKPTVSMKILSQFVEHRLGLEPNQVELWVIEEPRVNDMGIEKPPIDPDKDKMHVLRDEETLAQVRTQCTTCRGHMVLAYKMKENVNLGPGPEGAITQDPQLMKDPKN